MLDRCIAPLDRATFFARYWDQAPLHVARGRSHGFLDLLSVAELDRLLARAELRWPFVRFFDDGAEVPVAGYTERRALDGDRVETLTRLDACLAQIGAGATMSALGLETTSPAVAEFCAALAADLGARVHRLHTNCYLTPPAARGFAAHYDTHDVLVLQIEGRKRWLVHAGPLPLPTPSQTCGPLADEIRALVAATPPLLDVTLEAGDSLYLPRGFVHAAATSDVASLHLTIGLHVRRRLDVLAAAVEHALERCAAIAGYGDAAPLDATAATAEDTVRTYAELSQGLRALVRQELADGQRPTPARYREHAGLLAARARAQLPNGQSPACEARP